MKKILFILILAFLVFLYLDQRITLIELSYRGAELDKNLKHELVKKEEFVYKIVSLENPALLESKFLAMRPNFNLAKKVRIVKISYPQPKEPEQIQAGSKVSYADELP